MSDVPVSKLQDDDMQAAPTALMRAGVQARELARKTGTAVVIVRVTRSILSSRRMVSVLVLSLESTMQIHCFPCSMTVTVACSASGSPARVKSAGRLPGSAAAVPADGPKYRIPSRFMGCGHRRRTCTVTGPGGA